MTIDIENIKPANLVVKWLCINRAKDYFEEMERINKMNKTQEALQRVKKAEKEGYFIVSRKHRVASRIDREDWKEYMATKHAPWDYEQGLAWVNALGKHAGDFYRRVYSTDNITVPSSWLKLMKNSNEVSDE